MKIISGSALTNLLCFCLRDNFLFDIISHLTAFGTALQTGLGFYLSSSKRDMLTLGFHLLSAQDA